MEPSTAAAQQLRERGLRVTAGRLAVLRAVGTLDHPDAGLVVDVVRSRLGSVSTQAVYDTLAALTRAGLLRRIEPAGSPARYETRVGDNHHHLICRVCGRLVDVDCAVGSAPCLTASDDMGYEIDQAEVAYWGRCPACVTPSRAASPPKSPSRRSRGSARGRRKNNQATPRK